MQPGLEAILPIAEKPARYLGGETNAAPAPGPGDLRFVLCFPDIYEIGMSHRGLSSLYGALASAGGVAPLRCFAPWPDLAAELRRRGLPLAALENGLPLAEADVLGFSFPSPLNFTTALMMLDLAGVPLLAAERGEGDPLVIAGGQATFNPEPMADFLDAVALGEGEEIIVEIASAVRAARAAGASRTGTLRGLGGIEGVYVPSWYEAVYESGRFAGLRREPHAPARIRKRTVWDLGRLPAAPPIVANLPPTHDRLAVEVMRGCLWGCRFCQAGFVTRPARAREGDVCLAEVEKWLRETGAAEVSFLALNACDCATLKPLIEKIRTRHGDVKLSLPAARISSYRGEVSEALRARKSGQQTFAPEVGTDRLRRVINKEFTNEQVGEAVAAAGRAGCRNVKLYFMVGLPTETDDDAAAIGELIASCRKALRAGLGRGGKLSVSISPFVPQAHTPFQWHGLASTETLKRRLALAKRAVPRPVKTEGDVGYRVLEACLARGDRRLGPVLREAYRRGAAFDAWRDRYEAEAWAAAFDAAGLDMEAYACRELSPPEPLPWDHLDAGVSREYLRAEGEKAVESGVTPPCESAACRRCGACGDRFSLSLAPGDLTAPPAPRAASFTARRQRLRFTYGKTGPWRWLSHLELRRLVERQLRRAALPLSRSGGFSPRPRLVLAPALPVGAIGCEEYGEVALREATAPGDFIAAFNGEGPFQIGKAWEEPWEAPALEATLRGARYRLEFGTLAGTFDLDLAGIVKNVTRRLAEASFVIPTRRGVKDLNEAIRMVGWRPEEATLEMDLAASAAGALFDVAAYLANVSRGEGRAVRVTRVKVFRRETPGDRE